MADTEDTTRRGRDMTALEEAGGGKPNLLWIYTEDNNPYIGARRPRGADAEHRPVGPGRDPLGRLLLLAHVRTVTLRILSGIYPPAAGPAQHMRALATLPSHIKGFPELLRAAGYYTTPDQIDNLVDQTARGQTRRRLRRALA